MKKRILSILLSLCMVCMLLPTTALATGEGEISTIAELQTAFTKGGTYTLKENINVESTLILSSGSLTINGGGHTITYTSQYATITNNGNLTIKNLTINGNRKDGRCIYNKAGTLTMEKVTLTEANLTSSYANYSYGAGLYNDSGATAILTDCNIRDNTCYDNGGGFYNAGTLILENCAIVENTSQNYGGGGYNYGTLYMNNCTVANNQSDSEGSGIYQTNVKTAKTYLMNSTVTGNIILSNAGGGISIFGGGLYAVNSVFAFNYNNSSTLKLKDIDFRGGSGSLSLFYSCAYGSKGGSTINDATFTGEKSLTTANTQESVTALFNAAESKVVDTNTYYRPAVTEFKKDGFTSYGVYLKNGSALTSGGTTTYYERNGSTVKMSYGSADTALDGLTAADNKSAVTTYQDGTTRENTKDAIVIGALSTPPHKHALCQTANCNLDHNGDGELNDHDDVTFTAWDSDDSLPGTAGNYYLTADVTLSGRSWWPTNDTVLCLNGHTIKTDDGYDAITVPLSATFTLTDCKTGSEQGKITHGERQNGRGVYVNSNGTFNMYGGSISGNNTKGIGGGGVYVASDGKFTMNGGTISGNNTEGGTIGIGGGVYVASDGKFTMNGGTITGNKAISNGGGVYVVAGGRFKMTGGQITGNKATSKGGGVFSVGTFTMSGNASITGNKATSNGGGVYVTGSGTFNMSDSASISGNTAEIGNGGGVYMDGGEFTMSGGTIEENLATDSTTIYGEGGGVHINSGIFTMLGGSITGNQASEKGGGVCHSGGTFTVFGKVTVTGNKVSDTENNVYLFSDKSITIGNSGLDGAARIGVAKKPTVDNPIKIATNATRDLSFYKEIFTPDVSNEGYVITKDENNYLYLSTHQHSWTYALGTTTTTNDTITATCANCPQAGGSTYSGGSITIKAPAVSEGQTLTYDGSAKAATVDTVGGLTAPSITYKQGDNELTKAPTDAGTYTASITVDSKTASVEYTIAKKNLTAADFVFTAPSDLTYSGSDKTASVVATTGLTGVGGITVKYYNSEGDRLSGAPTDVGTYTVKIAVAEGANFNATTSELTAPAWTFTITAKNIAEVAADTTIPDKTYTGSAITPDVTLTYNDMTLVKGTDYTLSYSGNTDAGPATVTITGKGNYTGTKDITFNIKEADMTGITVTGYNAAYDGNAHGISVIVPNTYDGAIVTYSTDGTDYSFNNRFTDFTNGDKTVYYKVSKANYNDVKGSATVKITKARLVVDGTLAASANYGTAVKDIKNFSGATVKLGGTTIAGTWAFPSDATTVPNVGATTPYTATFTPNDGAGNYETLTQSVTPTISKVNPTAPTGLTGKQGNTLSSVTLPDGWTWVNGTTPMNTTGNQTFKANYAGSNNYNVASNVDVTVTVSNKDPQTNFKFAAATQTKTYGDADFTVAATGAETGSTVTYESSNTSVATVDNSGKVHILKAGTATITATASATPVYAETTASYALTVNKGTQTITVPDDKTIIKNGVAVDISDWASVAGVANGAAPGALSYKLVGSPTGVSLSDGKNLTVDSSATATSITIKVTAAEKEDYYNEATETFDVTVSAKGSATLTVTQDGWTYGGDTKSPSYTKPVGTIDDTINVTYAVKNSGVFSASAPTNAGNYTVKVVLETADTVYTGTENFTISPKTLTRGDLEFTTGSTFTKVYDGNTTCATATVQIKAGAMENESDALPDVSGTYAYDNANVNEASKVTFTSASSSNTNYVLPAGLICVHAASITKADQAALTVTSTTATYGTDLRLTVSGGTGDGAVTYVVTDGADKATVSESTLHPTKAGTVTVTATKSGGNNYNDVSSSATAITINKATPVVTPPSPVASLTYNGEEQTLITAGSTTGGELKYCLTSDGDYSTALPKATAAGDSNVYYKVVGDENFVDVAESYITVTIAKKNVTVAPKNVTITQGDAIPTFELNYTGLVDSDTLTHSEAPVFTCYEADGTTPVSTGTAVGTYTITWTNEGATTFTGDANYNVTKNATGTLTISARPAPPSDSGSSYNPPTYKVESEVTESTDGNVSFSKGSAKKGDTVTITVTPDRYYKVDGVTVKDKNGKEIAVTDNGDGTFSFKMPASKVTVEPVFSWDNPFTDVAEDTYYTPAVEWALKNDITNGAGDDTTFGPDAECTRAQIVTFLWRAAGCPEPAGLSSFADVSADAYYAKAVAWAVEQGITNGTGDGTTFSPDATCTRSQGVTFLYRSAGSPVVSDDIAFNDVTTGSYYSDAVVWATQNGVTDGTGNSKFSPVRDCTRAQIVTFLYRWMVK